MSDLGTPAKFAQSDYLRSGKVHHGDIVWGSIIVMAVGALGGTFFGILLGSLIWPANETFLGMVGGIVGFAFASLSAKSILPSYGVWSGECPHCAGRITVSPPDTAPRVFDCPLCKGQTLLDKEHRRFQVRITPP